VLEGTRFRNAVARSLISFAAIVAGCSSSGSGPPATTEAGSEGGGASCTPAAGQLPASSCNDTPVVCPDPPCTSSSSCLALSDNSGQSVVDLRIRKLHVTGPAALATVFVQQNLIDQGVNRAETCEGGDDGFGVLFRLDTAAKTLTAGGSPPQGASSSYCFVHTTNHGFAVEPVTSPATKAADGSWSATAFTSTFNVPIFAMGDLASLVTLPLRRAAVQGMQLSADGNCVGSYTASSGCMRWATAATLSGYITLEDADKVPIPQLGNVSLCTLLTSQTTMNCARDSNGKISAPGDYCSQTLGPATATCADSFWLAATFAASAVPIGDGSGVDVCMGSADAATE
jgi:hypothetical protein